MSNTYSLSDALERVRGNIINYQECFDESTEHYKQNQRLLLIIDVLIANCSKLTNTSTKPTTTTHT